MKYFQIFLCLLIVVFAASTSLTEEQLMKTKCQKYKSDLFQLGSKPTLCFIEFPIQKQMCKNCGSDFNIFQSKYHEFDNKSDPWNKYCSSQLLHSNSFTPVRQVYKNVKTQWIDANCSQCYADNNGTITQTYSTFIQYQDTVMTCLGNHTDADLQYGRAVFDADSTNTSYSVIACHLCRESYETVVRYHSDMEKRMKEEMATKLWRGMCGDMTELMNMTRLLWSHKFRCDSEDMDKLLQQYYWDKIVALEKESNNYKDKISTLEKESKNYKYKMATQDKKLMSQETAVRDSRSRIFKLETSIKTINTKLNKNIGGIIVTVDKFDARKNSGEVFYSPNFYSHWNGYKLGLNVRPGGKNDTHLSVWIKISPGEYDDRLSWPCKYRFEVSVVNQRTGESHNAVIFSYDTVPNDRKDSFNKPQTATEIFGDDKFISHFVLRNIDGLTVNNCVIIKFVAYPPP